MLHASTVIRRHAFALGALLVLAAIATARPAGAQDTVLPGAGGFSPELTPGWSFTPGIAYSGSWDDNVLVRGTGDLAPGDYLNVVDPRAQLNFNGRRGQLSASYDGGFEMYRQLNTLNTHDQHGAFYARRLVTPHLALFARDTFAAMPTTSLVELVGVPFVRVGSRVEDVRGGVEAQVARHTSLTGSYNFDWVQFDEDPVYASLLLGGHSHGGTLSLRHGLSELTTLTADYDIQHAVVAGGIQTFDVQNMSVGLERRISDVTRVFGSIGASRLGVSGFGSPRTGPAWRLGATHNYRKTSVDVAYSRSFVPQYGFGGTMQNEEITGHANTPLTRRTYVTAGVSWRRNEPLTVGELSLRSIWIEGGLGYELNPWLQVQAFYSGVRQTINQPGGALNRDVIGFQITTAKTLRIR